MEGEIRKVREKRKPSKFIGFRLPIKEVVLLDEIARQDNRTRNGLIRHVLAQYIMTSGVEPPKENASV